MSRRVGIVGHPVGHSLSPVFQAAAFRHSGIDATYDAWDTPPEALSGRVRSLRAPDVLGANVTIPHKEAVLTLLDTLDPGAAAIGAVNTIVNVAGRLSGANTDGPGFIAALREEAGFDPAGKRVLLVGAGGAARAIAWALAGSGVEALAIANRTADRAAALVAHIGGPAALAPLAGPGGGYDCIVNSTSVGMRGGPDPAGMAAPLAAAGPGCLVVDIVYTPSATPLLLEATRLGFPTLGGLPMLIHQGALAFERWTGVPAPVGVMFAAAREELARRESGPG